MGANPTAVSIVHVGDRDELVLGARRHLESGRYDVSITAVDGLETASEWIADRRFDCLVFEASALSEEETPERIASAVDSVPWLFVTDDAERVGAALDAGAGDVVVPREGVESERLLSRRLEHLLVRPDTGEREATEAAAELKREQAFTDRLLDTLDDVFYLLNPDGSLQRWNESLETVTGYTDAELDGMDALELFEGEDRERVAASITEVLETGSVSVEADFVTADGEAIPYEFTGARLTDGNGDLRGLVGIGRDVSERKSLQAELQRKASLLDHIFNQVPTALYVKDTEARHLRMSEYHSDPDGTIGKTDPEVYGETEYTKSTYADDMRVIEEGDRIINEEEYNPVADEWILTSKVPWRDEDGEIQGLIGVSRFITEKKEYERKLAVRNRAMAEAPVGITIHDATDHDWVVYANDEFRSLTGYDCDAIDGEGFAALTGAETDPERIERLDAAFADGESVSLVALLYRADGSPFWGRISVAPVTDEDGAVTHFVGFLQDVTETKEQAEEIERRLDEFGEMIAEELRTPLRDAEETVAALSENGTDVAVEDAVDSIRRVDKLIDDLATVHSFSVKSRDVFDPPRVDSEGGE